MNYLAVSGGGDNGAFGAGLMNGWTETGTRPEFKMVTGVSTGALIAPFAFLGSDYDATLREVYTTMTPEKVYRARGISAALFDDAMADTTPLSQVIAGYADQKMFDAIAREYQKGRLLMIGTTDLDAQRPVIWNIGALAASGHPGALDLFRKILRASAAIPGAFQPVLIDVEIDGHKYQEMHVDGGAIAQLFLYPASIDLSKSGVRRVRHAYIIRNARLDPDYSRERTAHHLDCRPRHQHHAGDERPERRAAHLLRHPARRRRLQPRLYRDGFQSTQDRRIRPGLHERALPIRLSAGQKWPRLAQDAAQPRDAYHGACKAIVGSELP